jgi:hypothetical protein
MRTYSSADSFKFSAKRQWAVLALWVFLISSVSYATARVHILWTSNPNDDPYPYPFVVFWGMLDIIFTIGLLYSIILDTFRSKIIVDATGIRFKWLWRRASWRWDEISAWDYGQYRKKRYRDTPEYFHDEAGFRAYPAIDAEPINSRHGRHFWDSTGRYWKIGSPGAVNSDPLEVDAAIAAFVPDRRTLPGHYST